MTDKRLRVGFVGGGSNSAVGKVHLSALLLQNRFDIVGGVFSRDPKVNKDSAEFYCCDQKKSFDTPADLISSVDVDALVILVPTPQHHEVIADAANTPVSIICEKPLLSSLSEWRTINGIGLPAHKLISTYNYTGYPMVREARALIKAGKLGRVLQVLVEMPNEGLIRPPRIGGVASKVQAWRLVDPPIPQALLDLTTHAIQLLRFTTGDEIQLAKSLITNQTKHSDIRDTSFIIGALNSGASFSIWTTKSALGERNGLSFRIFCEAGSLHWRQTNPEILVWVDCDGVRRELDRNNAYEEAHKPRYERFKVGHPAGYIEAFANYYEDIYNVVSGGGREVSEGFLFGMKDAFEELQVLESLSKSGEYERTI